MSGFGDSIHIHYNKKYNKQNHFETKFLNGFYFWYIYDNFVGLVYYSDDRASVKKAFIYTFHLSILGIKVGVLLSLSLEVFEYESYLSDDFPDEAFRF